MLPKELKEKAKDYGDFMGVTMDEIMDTDFAKDALKGMVMRTGWNLPDNK